MLTFGRFCWEWLKRSLPKGWKSFSHARGGAALVTFVLAIIGLYFYLNRQSLSPVLSVPPEWKQWVDLAKVILPGLVFLILIGLGALKAPYEIYQEGMRRKEQEKDALNGYIIDLKETHRTDLEARTIDNENLTLQVQKLKDQTTPLEISSGSSRPFLVWDEMNYYGLIGISNKGKTTAAQNVRVAITSIQPLPKRLQSPNFPIVLKIIDHPNTTINPGETVYFRLFDIERLMLAFSITFEGRTPFELHDSERDSIEEWHKFSGFVLTISASCSSWPLVEKKIKMGFDIKVDPSVIISAVPG